MPFVVGSDRVAVRAPNYTLRHFTPRRSPVSQASDVSDLGCRVDVVPLECSRIAEPAVDAPERYLDRREDACDASLTTARRIAQLSEPIAVTLRTLSTPCEPVPVHPGLVRGHNRVDRSRRGHVRHLAEASAAKSMGRVRSGASLRVTVLAPVAAAAQCHKLWTTTSTCACCAGASLTHPGSSPPTSKKNKTADTPSARTRGTRRRDESCSWRGCLSTGHSTTSCVCRRDLPTSAPSVRRLRRRGS